VARVSRLLILAGDGIGPEVLAETRRVAEWFVAERRLDIELREELFGIAAWKAHGALMRRQTWDEIVAADAILFGAIGSPEYDKILAEERKVDQLLRYAKTSTCSAICARCERCRRLPLLQACVPTSSPVATL
jgi:3-isopropylmalate dehydrogenase